MDIEAQDNQENQIDQDQEQENVQDDPSTKSEKPGTDLYEEERGKFIALLKENPKAAYEKYGLTFFHSLDEADYLDEQVRFGLSSDGALDYYNRGVAANQADKPKDAIKQYLKAEKIMESGKEAKYSAPESLPELIFNLGWCYMETGDQESGKKYLNQYLKLAENMKKRDSALFPDWKTEKEEIKEFMKAS